jgi:hypothetical protein
METVEGIHITTPRGNGQIESREPRSRPPCLPVTLGRNSLENAPLLIVDVSTILLAVIGLIPVEAPNVYLLKILRGELGGRLDHHLPLVVGLIGMTLQNLKQLVTHDA